MLKACLVCSSALNRNCTKYCSHKCQMTYQYDWYINAWLAGEVSGSTKAGVSAFVRRYMLTLADYRCTMCGWSEVHSVTGNIPLQIDHIDGNYTNSDFSNLRVLCPNCHSLTANYGSLNMGNGRKYRRTTNKELNGCKIIHCSKCNKIISRGSKSGLCTPCSRTLKFIVPREELEKLVWQYPISKLSEMYSVSHTAIRKRCSKLGIIRPGLGYWEKFRRGKL